MDPRGPSDAELVRRCRRGEPEAWQALVDRYNPLVYRLALRMLHRPQDAEDACQEVFLNMHRSFATFDVTRPLRPWVSRIAYNACLHRLRGAMVKATTAKDPGTLDSSTPAGARSPEQVASEHEATSYLKDAFEELAAQDRALLILRYREGMTDTQVAQAVDMPVNTVKTRIFRARAKLRARLTPALGEDA